MKNSTDPSKGKKKLKVYIPLIVVILIVLSFGWYWYKNYMKYISTDDAFVESDNVYNAGLDKAIRIIKNLN